MEILIPFHGANPENLYRAFNTAMPEKILDFSTNTNIFPCSEICVDVRDLASRYPDPECQKLCEIISLRENVNPKKILFTNGINEAIFLLSSVLEGRTGILQPCYSEYSRAFPNAENIFDINAAGNFKNFIIVNPNNPVGIFMKLSNIAKKFSQTNFIIDEAYIDFLLDGVPERLCDLENVILLRSLTKFFHLSGARIGYVIAEEEIISRLKTRQPSWSVNAFAQELAIKFLNDEKFYLEAKNFYRKHTPIFINALRESGFEVPDSSVNFFLIRVKNDLDVMKFLLKFGIAVRHTRNFPGLDGRYIRVATRDSGENIFFTETKNLNPDWF